MLEKLIFAFMIACAFATPIDYNEPDPSVENDIMMTFFYG